MIYAYNIKWIENLRIVQKTESWLKKGLISREQFDKIKVGFPIGFYQPYFFVKVGLFVFALVACLFFAGFIFAGVFNQASETGLAVASIVLAAGYFTALEISIKGHRLYHSGVDNAFLYSGLTALFAVLPILNSDAELWALCCFVLLILVPAIIRYADLVLIIIAFGALLVLVADIMMKSPLGTALLPFGLMLISAVTFWLSGKIKHIYYFICAKTLHSLSLITFYLVGNYYAVREGNALIKHLPGPESPQIDFAVIFYFFSAVIPFLYTYRSLLAKDRIMLLIGLAAFGFSVFTYKYYFGVLPLEIALTLGGAAMLVFAVWAIRFFRTTRWGISDEKSSERDMRHIEALIVAQQIGQDSHENDFEFGGGDFGGGGAEGRY